MYGDTRVSQMNTLNITIKFNGKIKVFHLTVPCTTNVEHEMVDMPVKIAATRIV